MSIWKKVESKILNKDVRRDMLENSLKEIGIGLDYGTTTINNVYGKAEVDAAFINLRTNKVTSLGIKFNAEGGINLEGDIWGTGLGTDGNQEVLFNKIAQYYQKNNLLDAFAKNGYIVESNTVNANGEIELEAVMY